MMTEWWSPVVKTFPFPSLSALIEMQGILAFPDTIKAWFDMEKSSVHSLPFLMKEAAILSSGDEPTCGTMRTSHVA